MNKVQTTLASATLALGAAFGTNAVAQDNAVSAERTQVTQDIIDCIENDVFKSIDRAFETAATQGGDVYAFLRANAMNTFMDCTAPLINLEITPDLRADENSGGLELLGLFGLAMDIVEKQGDIDQFTTHMDEVFAPELEAYIDNKHQEYDALIPE